jgi:hypothetical protein
MSDHTQGGIEWELGEAEHAIVAAGDDPAARAVAFRRHAEAIRNMMQGTLVPSFVKLVERALGGKIDPVAAAIDGLRSDVQQSAAEISARLGKHDDDIEALQAIVANNTARLDLFEAKVAEDIQRRLTHIEQIIAERPSQRAAEHQALLSAIRGMRVVADNGHDGD